MFKRKFQVTPEVTMIWLICDILTHFRVELWFI